MQGHRRPHLAEALHHHPGAPKVQAPPLGQGLQHEKRPKPRGVVPPLAPPRAWGFPVTTPGTVEPTVME